MVKVSVLKPLDHFDAVASMGDRGAAGALEDVDELERLVDEADDVMSGTDAG